MSRLLYIQTTTGRKILSPKEVTGVGVSKFQGSICVIWHGAAHKRDVHLTEEELRYVSPSPGSPPNALSEREGPVTRRASAKARPPRPGYLFAVAIVGSVFLLCGIVRLQQENHKAREAQLLHDLREVRAQLVKFRGRGVKR